MTEDQPEPEGRKARLPVEIKILVCATSAPVVAKLLEVPKLLGGAVVEVVESDAVRLGDDVIRHYQPDVLIADVRLENLRDLERLSQLAQQTDSPLYVMATSAESDVEGIRKLMRLGISDFLPQPLNIDELVVSLQNAARKVRLRKPVPSSQIVAFLHGSGGAGATTLAVNTAVAIKQARKDAKVCVLDFDLQFGQVALNLDLSSARGALDIIESPDRLDATFLGAAMTSHESGIDVLVAPEVLVALDAISPELALRILNVAMEAYDFIVVDMPVALTNTSQAILGRSSAVVLVGQLSIAGIRQLRRLASILAAGGTGDIQSVVVMNRYLGRWQGGIRLADAEKALGRKVDFTVANDYTTASAAVDRGIPLIGVSRRAQIVKDIVGMTDGILNKIKLVT